MWGLTKDQFCDIDTADLKKAILFSIIFTFESSFEKALTSGSGAQIEMFYEKNQR
jgi:hypothetical protein